jgi:hypothetical protein
MLEDEKFKNTTSEKPSIFDFLHVLIYVNNLNAEQKKKIPSFRWEAFIIMVYGEVLAIMGLIWSFEVYVYIIIITTLILGFRTHKFYKDL